MKILLTRFLFVILIVSIQESCCAQKLMNKINEASKLKSNDSLFINKPLSDLLRQIGPKIIDAYGEGTRADGAPGYFRFKFVTMKQNDSLKTKGRIPTTIVVYIKEHFDWDFKQRIKGKELVWTKEDLGRYGNLTVVGIRVYGEN